MITRSTTGWLRCAGPAIAVAATVCALAADARAAGECRFARRPPVVLKAMGPCNFDLDALSFAGEPVQQAACLLTPVQKIGRLGLPLAALPEVLANRVGRSVDPANAEALRDVLQERGLHDTLGVALSQPVAQANEGDPAAPYTNYFVIHDTSSPNFRGRPWPNDIDTDPSINNLRRYVCANKIERGHVFINRVGTVLVAHDFSVPWRATKFEMAVQFGAALKGLFLHVELVQPRRRDPGHRRMNDFQAPVPGFTSAQYDALALVYVVASVRAGRWLIPAFHAVIDEGIRNKHDDPQNFELEDFANSLETLTERLEKRDAAATVKSVP